MAAAGLPAGSEQLDDGERLAFLPLAIGLEAIFAIQRSEFNEPGLRRDDQLTLPPAQLSLPWTFIYCPSSLVGGAAALATMPLSGLVGGAIGGLAGLKFGVWDHATTGVGLLQHSVRLAAGIATTPEVQALTSRAVIPCLGRTATPGPRIAVIAGGLRGDFQPVVALAVRLLEVGCVVKLFWKKMSSQWDPYIDMARDMARAAQVELASAASFASMYDYLEAWRPDILLHRYCHVGLAWVLQEQRNIAPVEYTFWPDPPEIADLRYEIMREQKAILDKHLGMETLRGLGRAEVFEQTWHRRPYLCAFSEEIAQRRAYWPQPTEKAGYHLTGFWLLDEQQEAQSRRGSGGGFFGEATDTELEAFLAAGPPPVYLGWGSTTEITGLSASGLAELAVRALQLGSHRGIVLGNLSGLDRHSLAAAHNAAELQSYADEHVLWRRWLPLASLFPRCSAAVIHGGAGTTGDALRAGLPTVVTPVHSDQFYWGYCVEQLGAGVRTNMVKDLRAEELAAALAACTADGAVEQAAAVGRQLRAEDGAGSAAQWIQAYWRRVQGVRA